MWRSILIRRIIGMVVALLLMAAAWVIGPMRAAEASPNRWDSSVVYVENHARGWPVHKAAKNLAKGSSLTLRVVRKCPPEKPCIRVYDVRNLPGNTIGRTSSWSSDGHTVAAEVYLENTWAKKANRKQKRGLVCHELGHAVGLQHSYRGNTCMKQGAWKKRPAHISKSERRQLDRWY